LAVIEDEERSARLEEVIQPVLGDHGLELVELRSRRARQDSRVPRADVVAAIRAHEVWRPS